MLVALENIYAVLRGENPNAPSKILLGYFVDDVPTNVSETAGSVSMTLRHLDDARAPLGAPSSLFVADSETTMVHVDAVVPLLAMEHPGPTLTSPRPSCSNLPSARDVNVQI